MSKRKSDFRPITSFFQKKSKPGSYNYYLLWYIYKIEKFVGSHDSPPGPSQGVSSIDVTTVDVENESDTSISENEGALVEAGSVSHGGSDSCCSSTSSSTSVARESSSIECDIGKIQDSGVDIKGLSRDDKYRLLTTEPNPDPLSYPRTRPCPSLRRFKPDWLKHYPWMPIF